jgi:thiol-disulfide isomerase/thioredoxin
MNILRILILSLIVFSCKSDPKLNTGLWRAEVPTVAGTLPFFLEIEKEDNTLKAFAVNGDEKLAFDTLFISNDSLHLRMELFDAEITAKISDSTLHGVFSKKMADLSIRQAEFSAVLGETNRFKTTQNSAGIKEIAPQYAVNFIDGDVTYQAVGLFKQNGEKVTGTFLTTTGDYRYLDGVVDGDSLKLSCFDGNHVFLFTAKIEKDKLVNGKFCSSITYLETWEGIADSNAKLPDANTLTYLKPGYTKLDFSFADENGKQISINDEAYKGKITIVQVLGTWCPNCMDETKFLADFSTKHPEIKIIGLAFEKSTDPAFALPKIAKMKKRFGVTYPVLIAGKNDKADASEKLPMLNKIISFPTTIVIDKKGIVRKVHTGFSGPGTGEYYIQFVEEFNRFIDKLEKE